MDSSSEDDSTSYEFSDDEVIDEEAVLDVVQRTMQEEEAFDEELNGDVRAQRRGRKRKRQPMVIPDVQVNFIRSQKNERMLVCNGNYFFLLSYSLC